jgi:hypothetical protein
MSVTYAYEYELTKPENLLSFAAGASSTFKDAGFRLLVYMSGTSRLAVRKIEWQCTGQMPWPITFKARTTRDQRADSEDCPRPYLASGIMAGFHLPYWASMSVVPELVRPWLRGRTNIFSIIKYIHGLTGIPSTLWGGQM